MWREFSLMHELLCRAVLPALSLVQVLTQWRCVRYRLAEPPRKRKLKIDEWNTF